MEFSMLWHTTSKINNLHEVFLKAWHFPVVLLGFVGSVPKETFEKIRLLVTVRGPHDTNVWESATEFIFFPPSPLTAPQKKNWLQKPCWFSWAIFFFCFYPISVWYPYWEKAANWVQRSEITLLAVDRKAHLCSVQTCQPCWVQNFIASSYNIIIH